MQGNIYYYQPEPFQIDEDNEAQLVLTNIPMGVSAQISLTPSQMDVINCLLYTYSLSMVPEGVIMEEVPDEVLEEFLDNFDEQMEEDDGGVFVTETFQKEFLKLPDLVKARILDIMSMATSYEIDSVQELLALCKEFKSIGDNFTIGFVYHYFPFFLELLEEDLSDRRLNRSWKIYLEREEKHLARKAAKKTGGAASGK